MEDRFWSFLKIKLYESVAYDIYAITKFWFFDC